MIMPRTSIKLYFREFGLRCNTPPPPPAAEQTPYKASKNISTPLYNKSKYNFLDAHIVPFLRSVQLVQRAKFVQFVHTCRHVDQVAHVLQSGGHDVPCHVEIGALRALHHIAGQLQPL